MRTAIFIIAFIVISIGIAFTIRFTNIETLVDSKKEKKEKTKKKDKENINSSSDVQVLSKYDLPAVLKEISAIVYLDKDRFACVQDELGKIFIYNTSTEKIEKEVQFGAAGDYEGLAIAGNNAYVLRADGVVFKVNGYNGSAHTTSEHKTHLTVKQDTEGLCYDAKNNRLLVAIKGPDPAGADFKGIYAMSLTDYKMDKSPVYKINLDDPALQEFKGKKQGSQIQPSAIAVHPVSGDLYITEGTKPKLLIMDTKSAIKSIKTLSNKDFNQPEGISFSPDGELFISNEGNKTPGNILKVNVSGL
ncbi:MAG: SdiA-regulated domain-containing protein [Bacteroidota bacterium]